jgi:hypothetical protein
MSADEQATRAELLRRARERLRAALAEEQVVLDDGVRGDVASFLARLDAVDEAPA